MYIYETSKIQGATFLDLNNLIGQNLDPDLLADVYAIRSSIYNILMTPLGTRYRLPEFGSALLWLLMEPHDNTTAFQIKNAVLQSVGRWETRIDLDPAQTNVTPIGIDGYSIDIIFYMPRFSQNASYTLNVGRTNLNG